MKPEQSASKKEKWKSIRWVITVFLVTVFISGIIALISDEIMENSTIGVAFLILLIIVYIGIIFDVIGVAVTSAEEKPFHSMAARKVPGAQESIRLLRNAERVSSICNDVIGDICGVVSGSASATIAAQVLVKFSLDTPSVITLLMSALVAGITVGGKAIGKTVAINSCTKIVEMVGKGIWVISHLSWKRKKEKNR